MAGCAGHLTNTIFVGPHLLLLFSQNQMDTTKFLAYLRAERDRIAAAIAALETLEGIKADSAPALAAKPRRPKSRRTRHLHAVGRNGISSTARKRSAPRQQEGRTIRASAAKVAADSRQMSAQAGKQRSNAVKAWGAGRKDNSAAAAGTDADDSLRIAATAESSPSVPEQEGVTAVDMTGHEPDTTSPTIGAARHEIDTPNREPETADPIVDETSNELDVASAAPEAVSPELQARYRQMIAEATMRMESAPSVKAREKWRLSKENWERLLQKGQGVAVEMTPPGS